MIFQDYQDVLNNTKDYLASLIPVDLGLDFGRRWALVTLAQDGDKVAERRAFEFQTILSVDFVDESNVVTSIIEEGSFVSYNKVPLPAQIVMTVVLPGTESQQQTIIQSLRNAKNSTDRFLVVTPFECYANMNITALRYSRTVDRGATRTVMDLVLQEIREVSVITRSMSSAKQVKNASSVVEEAVGKVVSKVPSVDVGAVLRENVGTVSERLGQYITDF